MPSSAAPRLPSRLVHTLKDHQGPVNVVRYNTGGRYCLSAGKDRSVRLWNPSNGTLIKTYSAHAYEIHSLAIAQDNATFASAGADKSILLWDVMNGTVKTRLADHAGVVKALQFNDDGSVLMSAGYDARLRFWDMKAKAHKPIQSFNEAKNTVTSIHCRGSTIIVGSTDGTARLYDIRKGQVHADYMGSPISSVQLSKDTQTTLISTMDSTIRLMDAVNGKLLQTFRGHRSTDYQSKAAFGHEEASVITGDDDGRIWAWDVLRGKPITSDVPPPAHSSVISWTDFHPEKPGSMITAGGDGVVRVWEL